MNPVVKEKKTLFGKENYLLGKRKKDGKKVWLEAGSFDCGWYWGFGYVEIYNHIYSDINEHTHFYSLFLEKDLYNSYINYFKVQVLSEKEIWQLLELMKSFYTMQEYAETVGRGGAHITTNPCSKIIQNLEEQNRINEFVIPAIMQAVYNLLEPQKREVKI